MTVCGEMGSDPAALLMLLAMGFRKISINGHNLAKVKWVISKVNIEDAKRILGDVLQEADSHSVHERLNLELENMGLGGLVRAGK